MSKPIKIDMTLGELLKIAFPVCPSCDKTIENADIVCMCKNCFWAGHATECKQWQRKDGKDWKESIQQAS